MTPARPAFERRVLSALDARPARIPVLVGSCGTGRTYLAAQHPRAARRVGVPVHRRRALGDDAGAAAADRAHGLAVQRGRCRPRRAIAARGLRHAHRVLPGRARPDRRAGDVPAGRGTRVPDVRELPGPAARVPRPAGRPRGLDEPLRPDDALHHARAATAARPGARHRGRPAHAALRRRAPRGHGPGLGRRRRSPARRARADQRARRVRAGDCRRHARHRRRSDQRARRRCCRPTATSRASSPTPTSCACIARAATARSRPSSTSSPSRNR